MAWTKAKTAILVGAIAIAVPASTVVGVKLVQAHRANQDMSSGLSPTMMNQLYTVGADGSISFDGTFEETNTTSRVIRTDTINDVEKGDKVISVTDASGRPMKYKRLPDRGVVMIFNKAVPPGQSISYTIKEISSWLSFRTNPSGEYVLDFTQQQGNEHDMRLVEVWRLPAGATLVTKRPPDMTVSTNSDGQIEVRLDKVVPPNGTTPFTLGYRLATAAN